MSFDMRPIFRHNPTMNITQCPPGYAYGYAPQGELQSWMRDMERTSDPVTVLLAARNKASYEKINALENRLTYRSVHGGIKQPFHTMGSLSNPLLVSPD